MSANPPVRHIDPDDPPFPTCDWGGCDELTVALRYDPEHGWLPVCERHGDECGHGCGGATGHKEGCPVHCYCFRDEP